MEIPASQDTSPRVCGANLDEPFLEPLQFSTAQHSELQHPWLMVSSIEMGQEWHGPPSVLECLMCTKTFEAISQRNELFKHMVQEHRLVISETKLIADLSSYMSYWKQRFASGAPLTDYCAVIQTNSKDTDIGTKEQYYLLCDSLPEDRVLREKLQHRLLVQVLEDQQRERVDTAFSKRCLFCLETLTGNRSLLINHMNDAHNFNIGHPDNIVYIAEFVDIMHAKLERLQCLFCEKIFKDRATLKEHMRKKQHRKLDPRNTIYDKYYIINYLELGKNWQAILEADDHDEDVSIDLSDDTTEPSFSSDVCRTRYCGSVSDWTDWQETVADSSSEAAAADGGGCAFCLFCRFSSSDADQIFKHMELAHGFDVKTAAGKQPLNFYSQVKLINYVRRQVHQCLCIGCFAKFESREKLLHHMTDQQHFRLTCGDVQWNQAQFYFSTYEDDALLLHLQDDAAEEEGTSRDAGNEAAVPVIAEDLPPLFRASLRL